MKNSGCRSGEEKSHLEERLEDPEFRARFFEQGYDILKHENDAIRAENETLRKRVAELELFNSRSRAQIASMGGEIDRYRKALDRIVEYLDATGVAQTPSERYITGIAEDAIKEE